MIRNSVSFYNRTLRAIYNKAVRRFRIPDTRPFCESYTGVDRTRSRSVGEPLLARLSELDLSASREKLYRYYQSRLSVYNRRLKEFSAMLGEGVSLSSYVLRHSWATAARNNNVSLTVISEGLGHSSERMTRIYLGNFNTELIDKANSALMHRIRRFVSMRDTNNCPADVSDSAFDACYVNGKIKLKEKKRRKMLLISFWGLIFAYGSSLS